MPKAASIGVRHDDVAPSWWDNDQWGTPPAFVDRLARAFILGTNLQPLGQRAAFDLDPCATRRTAKAPRFYTERDNGLRLPWDAASVFVNPPYSSVLPWARKAVREVLKTKRAKIVVMLLPVCTDTRWFHDYVLPFAELHYVRGRVPFLDWEGRSVNQNRGPSLIAVYRPGFQIEHYASYSIPARHPLDDRA